MRSETQEKPRIPGGAAKRWVGSPDPGLGGAWEARVGFVASTSDKGQAGSRHANRRGLVGPQHTWVLCRPQGQAEKL